MTRDAFMTKYPEWFYLYDNLLADELSWEKIKKLPGITKRKLNSLIKKHKEGMNK
jgi:hypothetical protein